MVISPATRKDISTLVELINSGYRGQDSKKGWTTEADLLDGNIRIDAETLDEMLSLPEATMIAAKEEDGSLAGCVYLHGQEKGVYLGLLTVSPSQQGTGIGKKLLSAAEKFTAESGRHSIFMTVISVRSELVQWYERHGYHLTGETKPFPDDDRFGTPTQPLEFVILKKDLVPLFA